MAPAELSHSHRKTYEHLFSHPMPQNLDWNDVLGLLKAMPGLTVDETHDGHVKAARDNQTLTLRRPKGKDFSDKAELSQLKRFLDHTADAPAADETAAPAGSHLLVVIDHKEARVYATEMRGAVPYQIKPYNPFGYTTELRSSADDGNGKRSPERKSFYEAVARTLRPAKQVLLFGTGTGASSAMDHLVEELNHFHKDLAPKIVGTVKVDEHHLTDDQLLAKAREFFKAE